MASIRKEFVINERPENVWAAVRDIGSIHKRLVPGFVTDCRLDGNVRIVKFGNGMEVRELIVDLDDPSRRLVWSVVSGTQMTHHNASMQVFAEGERATRAVWIADLLPNELAPGIGAMIEQGANAMKQTLERQAAVRS